MKLLSITSILSAVVLFSSCSKFLEEEPSSFVGADGFFKTEEQIKASVNGVYMPLTSIYSQNLIIATEGVTDLAFLNSSSVDAKMEISPANPGMGDDLWQNAYKGVMYANASIAGIKRSTVDEAKKGSYLAEAITLRAVYYYLLTSTFNGVPYYTKNVNSVEVLEEVNKLPRTDANIVRDSLIQDLQAHVELLPQKRTSDITGNRVSAPLAYMLIAKMALWNKKYELAKEALLKIKEIYGDLAQYPLVDTYYRNKNTPESIFEVQYAWSTTGIKKTTQVACFFTPAKKAGTATYDGVDIPELGDKANPFTSITPSEYFMGLYDVYDPRREIILAYTYNGKNFSRPMANNGTGKAWMGPKFWCPGMQNLADGNNQKVFRYADALLMLAECANELGDTDLAMSSINAVKKRAEEEAIIEREFQLASYPGKAEFFKEVQEERARELMGEYGRKYDLVRWDIYASSIQNTIAEEFPDIKSNFRPYHRYYPIPDVEVVKSEGALSNPEYTGQ